MKTLRVSNMARAKETAQIIGQHLPDSIVRMDPDPNLNEGGLPCHTIPGGTASKSRVAMIEEGHSRIEAAFEYYFHRADEPVEVVSDSTSSGGNGEEEDDTMAMHPQHEFEIIACHGNVIRYFFAERYSFPRKHGYV